nr:MULTISPECIES: PIN domain-containing protein [unclassified Methanoregula]
MKILLDANALMMPAQYQIDLFDELRALVGGYEPLVLKRVMNELEGISREKGQTGAAARMGLTIGSRCTVAEDKDLKPGTVDEQVVDYAVRNGCLVVTNDRRLRDELYARGIGVISMRKQKKLELLRR